MKESTKTFLGKTKNKLVRFELTLFYFCLNYDYRGFGVTDGPAINESFCTCLMEGPHRC